MLASGLIFSVPANRLACLRRQHRDFERTGYDGHNRRSGLVPMRRYRMRRRRRQASRRLRTWLQS